MPKKLTMKRYYVRVREQDLRDMTPTIFDREIKKIARKLNRSENWLMVQIMEDYIYSHMHNKEDKTT